MTERLIPVPESALRALALPAGHPDREKHYTAIATLVACLPEPEPTFSDEEALAFFRVLWPTIISPDDLAVEDGRKRLTRLAKAKWHPPKALCPPPSPALVELVEAAREYVRVAQEGVDCVDEYEELRAAVAAYDEEG